MFTILGPEFGILAIPSGQYIELDMRNPIFRSEMKNSGVWRSKIRKNYLRKIRKRKKKKMVITRNAASRFGPSLDTTKL